MQRHNSLAGIPVQHAMLADFRIVQPDDPLTKAVEYALEGWQQDFPVVIGDRVLGMLTREDLTRALAHGGIDALSARR